MIGARALVERVEGGHAWVRLRGHSAGCGRCDKPGGCRSAGIANPFKSKNEVFALPNLVGAEAGDSVRLRMADDAPLWGALLVYGVGVCLLLIGAAIGNAVALDGREDLFALMGGATGLLVSLVLNRMMLRRDSVRRGFQIELMLDSVDRKSVV